MAVTFFGNDPSDAEPVTDQLRRAGFDQNVDLSLVPLTFAPSTNFDLLRRWVDGEVVQVDGTVTQRVNL